MTKVENFEKIRQNPSDLNSFPLDEKYSLNQGVGNPYVGLIVENFFENVVVGVQLVDSLIHVELYRIVNFDSCVQSTAAARQDLVDSEIVKSLVHTSYPEDTFHLDSCRQLFLGLDRNILVQTDRPRWFCCRSFWGRLKQEGFRRTCFFSWLRHEETVEGPRCSGLCRF